MQRACVLAAALAQTSAVQLSSRDSAAEVGAALRDAAEKSSVLSGEYRGAEFQRSLVEDLTRDEAVLVNPEVSKVLRATNKAAATLSADSDDTCTRRWTASCPDGWDEVGAGSCAAPSSYKGPCAHAQSFVGKSVNDKRAFVEDCNAPWPCQDECSAGRDYSSPCPVGWTSKGNGLCEAPSGQEQRCGRIYDFEAVDDETKDTLANTCGFNWPCKTGCSSEDLSSACPEGWSEVPLNKGYCLASASYSGPCNFMIHTGDMTADQKKAFAAKCGVRFPCASSGSSSSSSSKGAGASQDGPVR